MELSGLTEKVLRETMRQLKLATTAKKYLVIVTGGSWGIPQTSDFLERCVSNGTSVTLVLSSSAEAIMSRQQWFEKTGLMQIITSASQISMTQLLKEHEQVVVPILTINSAAKIAQGISDTLATKLIFHGLVMGKKVVAARESCDLAYLSYYENKDKRAVSGLEKLTNSNLKQVEELGIELTTIDFLIQLGQPSMPNKDAEAVNKTVEQVISLSQKVITESDIRRLPNRAKLRLSERAIITPSAKDMAKEKEILFI